MLSVSNRQKVQCIQSVQHCATEEYKETLDYLGTTKIHTRHQCTLDKHDLIQQLLQKPENIRHCGRF